jgi:predicted ester cyclase
MAGQSPLQEPVRRVFDEVWNAHCPALIPEVFSEDFRLLLGDGSFLGRQEFQEAVCTWQKAFPDIVFSIERSLFLENQQIVSWRAKGTHRGVFMNIAPSGRRIDFTGMTWFELSQGLVSAARVESDMMSLLSSLSDASDLLSKIPAASREYVPADYALDGGWSVDTQGAGKAIYEWAIKCRATPSANRMLVEGLRRGFAMTPMPDVQELTFSPELMAQVTVEEKWIPGPRGDIRLLLYRPSPSRPLPPVFLLHPRRRVLPGETGGGRADHEKVCLDVRCDGSQRGLPACAGTSLSLRSGRLCGRFSVVEGESRLVGSRFAAHRRRRRFCWGQPWTCPDPPGAR